MRRTATEEGAELVPGPGTLSQGGALLLRAQVRRRRRAQEMWRLEPGLEEGQGGGPWGALGVLEQEQDVGAAITAFSRNLA